MSGQAAVALDTELLARDPSLGDPQQRGGDIGVVAEDAPETTPSIGYADVYSLELACAGVIDGDGRPTQQYGPIQNDYPSTVETVIDDSAQREVPPVTYLM